MRSLPRHSDGLSSDPFIRVLCMRGRIKTWVKAVGILALTFVATIAVLAQVDQKYILWPVVYNMAEELVVKRGADADGVGTNFLYFRLGWGPCLRIDVHNLIVFANATTLSEYSNVRDYADSVFDPTWGVVDDVNCPNRPQEVKPWWRGTRPTYNFKEDAEGNWVKGNVTVYRVEAGNPATQDCETPVVRKADGRPTSYRQLAPMADITNTRTGEQLKAFEAAVLTPYGLIVACQGKDTSVEDYRF